MTTGVGGGKHLSGVGLKKLGKEVVVEKESADVLQLLGRVFVSAPHKSTSTGSADWLPLLSPHCPLLWVSKGAFLGGRGVGICSSLPCVFQGQPPHLSPP